MNFLKGIVLGWALTRIYHTGKIIALQSLVIDSIPAQLEQARKEGRLRGFISWAKMEAIPDDDDLDEWEEEPATMFDMPLEE